MALASAPGTTANEERPPSPRGKGLILQSGGVSGVKAQFLGFEQPAHDLAATGFGKLISKVFEMIFLRYILVILL